MNTKFVIGAFGVVALLQACDSSTGVVVNSERPVDSRPDSSNQVDVFNENVRSSRIAPESLNTTAIEMYDDGGFEGGLGKWIACKPGAINLSSNAFEGSNALELQGGNCFYRSIEVTPGESYTFSCQVKLTTGQAWTGMGMTFANAEYESLLVSPVAVATSNEYMRLDTTATAPDGTLFLSTWFHSDNGAIIDNCSLTLEENQPPSETVNAENFLENGNFSVLGDGGGAAQWVAGCNGTATSDGTSLYVADGACVDQAFSASEVSFMGSDKVAFSCLVTEVSGYSDLSLFLDGKLVGERAVAPSEKNTRVELLVDSVSATNGFVSLYSEGYLKVEDCVASVAVSATDTTDTTAGTSPADPAPVDPTPVDPTPVDPTPVDPTPVDPTPVDPTPVDPTPVDPTPVDPTPVDPTPVDPTPTDPTPAPVVTFSSIQANVFEPACASCHGAAFSSGGLNLSDTNASYNALVGVESSGKPGSVLVIRGDADNSYLIQKLEGTPGIAGSVMPPNGNNLPEVAIQQVRAWIAQGAMNN